MFKGQSIAEYCIAAALVSIAAIGAITILSNTISDVGQQAASQMAGSNNNVPMIVLSLIHI